MLALALLLQVTTASQTDTVKAAPSFAPTWANVQLQPVLALPPTASSPDTLDPAGVIPAAASAPTAADTLRKRARPVAIEYSSGYAVRLKIHKLASWATLPLFVGNYFTGRDLYDNSSQASSFSNNFHRPLATGVAALFAVNSVTGIWNMVESGKDPKGKTRRLVHSISMLAADAGFAITGIVAADARNDPSRRDLHRKAAIASMSVALASYLMMFVWKD